MQRLVMLMLFATFFLEISSELQYGDNQSGTAGLGEIAEVSREPHLFYPDGGSILTDVIDHLVEDFEIEKLIGVKNYEILKYSSNKALIDKWRQLTNNQKEVALRFLYPFLVSDASAVTEKQWSLHCAHATELCKEDSSCEHNYDKFMTSCSADELKVFDRDSAKGIFKNQRRARRRNKFSAKTSIKRDVEMVQKRIREKSKKRTKKRRRKNKRRSMKASKSFRSKDLLRYFSLHTKSYKCDSNCVYVLSLLNNSIYGKLFARCDCRAKTMPTRYREMLLQNADESTRNQDYLKNWENTCYARQRIAQECVPRLYPRSKGTMGCTEAHEKCDSNPTCKHAQDQFVIHCGQVINGIHCSSRCRETLKLLRNATKDYDTCVCDGTNGHFCSEIRKSIVRLCEDGEHSGKSSKREIPVRPKNDNLAAESAGRLASNGCDNISQGFRKSKKLPACKTVGNGASRSKLYQGNIATLFLIFVISIFLCWKSTLSTL